jgi:hypothetical protein
MAGRRQGAARTERRRFTRPRRKAARKRHDGSLSPPTTVLGAWLLRIGDAKGLHSCRRNQRSATGLLSCRRSCGSLGGTRPRCRAGSGGRRLRPRGLGVSPGQIVDAAAGEGLVLPEPASGRPTYPAALVLRVRLARPQGPSSLRAPPVADADGSARSFARQVVVAFLAEPPRFPSFPLPLPCSPLRSLMATPARAPKVAIVGSGLAGLTAAWLLQQEADRGRPVEVHLFEKVCRSRVSGPRN